MPDKTKEQLEDELKFRDLLNGAVKEERTTSDSKYAIKLVELIVFAAMAIIAGYFLNQMLQSSSQKDSSTTNNSSVAPVGSIQILQQ